MLTNVHDNLGNNRLKKNHEVRIEFQLFIIFERCDLALNLGGASQHFSLVVGLGSFPSVVSPFIHVRNFIFCSDPESVYYILENYELCLGECSAGLIAFPLRNVIKTIDKGGRLCITSNSDFRTG